MIHDGIESVCVSAKKSKANKQQTAVLIVGVGV